MYCSPRISQQWKTAATRNGMKTRRDREVGNEELQLGF